MAVAWADEVADVSRPVTASWADGVEFRPPVDPVESWIGRKELTAATMAASAAMAAPAVESGSIVVVPPGRDPGLGFPYVFDFEFPAGIASMVAASGMLVDSIGGMPVDVQVESRMESSASLAVPEPDTSAPEIIAPAMGASADLLPPVMGADLVVFAPNMGGDQGLPYTFDFIFGGGRTGASMAAPTVNYVVSSPAWLASAGMIAPPTVAVDAVVDSELFDSSVVLLSPVVSVGYEVQPPRFTAHASLQGPTAADGDLVPAPPMSGIAELLVPDIGVFDLVTVEPPTMGGVGDGFPYVLDFVFTEPVYPTRATMVAPSVDYMVSSPIMAANAGMLAGHGVGLGAIIETPRMASTALLRAAGVESGASPAVPRMNTSAAFPGGSPWISDVFVTVTANQRVVVPRWCRYIGFVVLGGGAGGAKGSAFSSGAGGKPGVYVDGVWDRNSTPEIGSVNCSIGGGGNANGGGGGGTTIWGDAYDEVTYSGYTATGNGGSGTNSGRDAQGPGNRSAQGISAVGGTGNGNEPGSGGRGGASSFPSGGNGSAGAKGRIWLRFWM